MAALEHLLGAAEMDLPDRFLHHARVAGQAFTLAVSSPEALRYRDDLSVLPGSCDGVASGTYQ